MAWTSDTISLLFIGWMVWLLWVVLGPLLWIPTASDGWDRVPRGLGRYERAARRRIGKIPDDRLPPPVREIAVVLEAQERCLTWRLLAGVLLGLLSALLPLTLLMFFSSSGSEPGERTGLALDRLPSAVGVVTVAVLPLALTGTALVMSVSRLSWNWPSSVEVWRHLHVLMRDGERTGWRGAALQRTGSLRNLAAALERDFMRVAGVSEPLQLQRRQRAVVGGVLDHHDWLIRRPNRTVAPALTSRFAGGWLTGDWPSLHAGTVRDHPALPQRTPWFGRQGMVIAVVVYLALTAAVLLGGSGDQDALSSTIGVLITPLVIVVLGASVRSWGGRGVPATTRPPAPHPARGRAARTTPRIKMPP